MECSFCKSVVAEGASKCSSCGEWLSKADARRAAGGLHPAVKLVAVLVMVALAYWFVFGVVYA